MSTEVSIAGETIRLGQLLKLAGLASSGSEAKELLAAGLVTVDGVVDTRRGRQLQVGSRITFEGQELLVVSAA